MKKILILNWRDPKSPLEGGAERFTQKYAEHWASQGNQVTWITNSFFKSKKTEIVNKVSYIRLGPALDGKLLNYVVYYPLFLINSVFYISKYIKENKINIVIDEIHGFPFFTPLYSSARNILLACEVAGPIWDKMFPFPINLMGKISEKLIYIFYKETEIWAISDNTKKNIQELLPNKEIKVIPLGVEPHTEIINKLKNVKKTEYPSAIFLARLVKMKGIEAALDITAFLAKKIPGFKLIVVGGGDAKYVSYLKEKIKSLDIEDNIQLVGKVSEAKKFEYLKKAHFLLHPSYKEGFGITILEAALVGTPTVARNGSGMDALIKHGYNGYLFDKENELYKYIKKLISENEKFSQNCKNFVQNKLWNTIFNNSKI